MAENHGGRCDRARNIERRDDSTCQREKDRVRRSEKRGELRIGKEGEKQKNDLTLPQEQNRGGMRRKARTLLVIVQEIARNLHRWLLHDWNANLAIPGSLQGPKWRTSTKTCLEDSILPHSK